MNSLIKQIKNEQDIEKLRSLFLQEVTKNEAELVQIHETHEIQVDMLQQQLSDQNIAVSSLQAQIKKLKEMHEKELDNVRINERQCHDLLKANLRENNELKSKMQQIETSRLLADSDHLDQTQNALSSLESQKSDLETELSSAREVIKNYKDTIQTQKEKITEINSDLQQIKRGVTKFIKSTFKSLQVLHHLSERSSSASVDLFNRLRAVYSGLGTLKQQVHDLHSFKSNSKTKLKSI